MLILTKEQAQEVLWDDSEEYEVVQDEQTDTSRWSSHHYLVIAARGRKAVGPWYATTYSRGLTEQQDERPFEYDDEVTFNEVVPHQRVITEFKPKVTTIEGQKCQKKSKKDTLKPQLPPPSGLSAE